jgi:competence protein ComEC
MRLGWTRSSAAFVIAAVVVFLCACDLTPSPREPGPTLVDASNGFRVVFIDVGQGDAELVTAGGHNMLIDGGRTGDIIVRRLNALHITHLDAVVATHPDADHVGGLAAVLEAYDVGDIYVNGDASTTETYDAFLAAAAAEPGALIHTLTRGDTISLGGFVLPVLNPAAATGDTNSDSIVLRLACGPVSVLFTGDADATAEAAMLAAGVVIPTTVLKAGHHGASTSTSGAFLAALTPDVAVISAGRDNLFGHPAPETMARLAAIGASFEYTDTSSADDSVTMTTDCATYSFAPAPTSLIRSPQRAPTAAPVHVLNPVSTAASFTPPACFNAGSNTCDCSDFTAHAWAQWFHDTLDPTDISKLDGPDHDGVVCESLP